MSNVPGLDGFFKSQLATSKLQQEQAKSKVGTGTLGKEDFLKLLLIQLKNQDPLNPFDNKEMVAQQAQFSSLEQLQNISSTLESANQITQASTFIGKNITVAHPDNPDTLITGVVTAAHVDNGKASIVINDISYPLNLVRKIT